MVTLAIRNGRSSSGPGLPSRVPAAAADKQMLADGDKARITTLGTAGSRASSASNRACSGLAGAAAPVDAGVAMVARPAARTAPTRDSRRLGKERGCCFKHAWILLGDGSLVYLQESAGARCLREH